jgi:hypothetical protein
MSEQYMGETTPEQTTTERVERRGRKKSESSLRAFLERIEVGQEVVIDLQAHTKPNGTQYNRNTLATTAHLLGKKMDRKFTMRRDRLTHEIKIARLQ